MVAVDHPDPPGEAKIKYEQMGVPPGAPPMKDVAESASTWGATSADELPDDYEETYGEAIEPAYA